ncbi:MAG: PleD family two-component response regulator [Oceanicoccus sp.]
MSAVPTTKYVPASRLSNLGQDSDIEKAMELGSVDYLIKTDLSLKEILKKETQLVNK